MTLNQKIAVNATYGKWAKIKHDVPKFRWRDGHPAGYTDDLGIIADRNQWVDAVSSGWVSNIQLHQVEPIREWCTQNLKHGCWQVGFYSIFLKNEKDVAWFLLRWS